MDIELKKPDINQLLGRAEERSTTGGNSSGENAGVSQSKPLGLVCSCQLMVALNKAISRNDKIGRV